MKKKIMPRFRIKVFNKYGALVKEFTLAEETKNDAEKTVREWMTRSRMDAEATFKIS